MINRVLRWLAGEIELRIHGAELERFLNRCAAAGVQPARIHRTDLDEMTARITVREWYQLYAVHRRTRCRVHIVRRMGLPFVWKRWRSRYGIWLGLVLIAAVCVQLNTRIWVIQTEFPDGVDGMAVMQELEQMGVHTGIRSDSIDAKQLKAYMMQTREDLSFFAVNVDGCILSVVTGAAKDAPELENRATIRSVVATKDGVIQKQIVHRGTPEHKTNDAVVRGEILVDALVEPHTEWGERYLVSAAAEIWAETKQNQTYVMTDCVQKKQYTGQVSTRYALCLGKTRINFYQKRCPSEEKCDRISLVRYVRLNDWLTLPIALYSETCRYYTVRTETVQENRLLARIRSAARRDALAQIEEGSLISSEITWEQQDGRLTAQTSVWCYEQIGAEVEDGRTQSEITQESNENEESET
ncbi:MAG: sporulation protein YqfD [Butyricicoccus sp.]